MIGYAYSLPTFFGSYVFPSRYLLSALSSSESLAKAFIEAAAGVIVQADSLVSSTRKIVRMLVRVV